MSEVDSRWHRAAATSLSQWGLSVAPVELLSHSENLVYRVNADSGQFGLRIHRPGYHTRPELLSEQQWLISLNNDGCSVPTPVLRPSGDGIGAVAIEGEAPRHASLVRWVDGDLLGAHMATVDPDERLQIFTEIGRTMAHLHRSAAAWSPPPAFQRVHWDADGLMGDNPVWGRFWEVPDLAPAQSRLLKRARNRCRETLANLPKDPTHYSLIHADMHPYNLIHTANGIHVIDFDDSGFGWHIYDIAVALFNFWQEPDFQQRRVAFFDGYRSVFDIDEQTEDLLELFFVVRSLIWLAWIYARPDIADSKRRTNAIKLVCADAKTFLD